MESKKYNQLLAEVILMPLINTSFNANDPLHDYIKAYYELVNKKTHDNYRSETKKAFSMAQNALLDIFIRDLRWEHLDNAHLLIEAFYSGIKMSELYDYNTDDLGAFYLQHIFNIARTFVTFRDGIISVRNRSDENDPLLPAYSYMNKLELWNNISRTATSDLFISAACVNFGITDTNYLINIPNLVNLSDIPLRTVLKKGVAETHMHMNAGISYSYHWKCCMDMFDYKGKTNDLWFCTLFRFYSAKFLEEHSEYQSYSDFLENLEESFKITFYDKYIFESRVESPSSREIKFFIENIEKEYGINESAMEDILFDTVFVRYKEQGTSSEIIWYHKLLTYLKNNYDKTIMKHLLIYIRNKNSYFNDKIQQTKIGGLEYFKRHYDHAVRVPRNPKESYNLYKEKIVYSIFQEQCRTGNLKLLELKISPNIISSSHTTIMSEDEMQYETLKQLKTIFKAYSKYINDTVSKSANPDKLCFPKIGIVYHFIKQNDSDNFNGYNCVINDKSAEIDCMDYNTMRNLNIKFSRMLRNLFEKYPLISDYVVGIDAAALENSAEPWVFAPVFRDFRPSNYVLPISMATRKNIQNIGLTYHVGEDFRHIISGLRHIDEVLSHFNYCSGDRLGHAIALGVDIDKLAEDNPIVVIPVMEYLENLLWMWSKVKSLNLSNAPGNLEYKIMNLAQSLYSPECAEIDVYTLWRVYNEKFNLLTDNITDKVREKSSCKLVDQNRQTFRWTFENLLCTHFCPCYYERYNQSVFVKMTKEEIEFCKSLQKDLINKIEKYGVYVETNPSSNLSIGDVKSIFSHPILKINKRGLPIDNGTSNCIMATINSDDPIIFSTCVENEFAYVYYSLLNAGCSREETLQWIDKIREYGMDSSFVKYDKDYKEMLKDFEEIQNY